MGRAATAGWWMGETGWSAERAALICQHSDDDRQREVTDGLERLVRIWCKALSSDLTTQRPRPGI
jgi:hypothetical protein